MNPLLKLGQDRFDNTVKIVIDVGVHETNDLIAAVFQMVSPLLVKANFMIC